MKKTQILIVLLALAAVPAASQVAPPAAKQWNVNNADTMSYATEYELFNTTAQLGYDDRTFGVNLGWVGHSGGYFEFVRQAPAGVRDHRRGPIASDESVAIYNTKTRRYLMYYKRGDAEAELEWSNTPVYEWQIQDESASSGRVHFALFDNRIEKYLVHQFKNRGIDLGWLNYTPPALQSFSVAMLAQQNNSTQPYNMNQPWVAYLITYLGGFGQNKRGNLLTVQNASQTDTLWFLKPGKSTKDCSDANATVPVAPRGMMTADQMKTLYGSATPRLAINFLACLTTPTKQRISVTYVNITYKLDP